MVACSTDDASLTSTDSSAPVSVVQIVNGEIVRSTRSTADKGDFALSFANEQALNDFENKIAKLSDAEAQQLVNKMGVENLYNLENSADEELEAIGNKATSIEEFNEEYATYVTKYKGRLVRDTKHAEDLSLIVPYTDNYSITTKNVLPFIANKNAEIVVANKVRKINIETVNKEYASQQLQKSISPYGIEDNYTNGGSFTYPGKKFYYTLNFNYAGGLNFSMEAKKKMWYG